MNGAVVEIVGDSLCCHYIFENGGSQVVHDATGTLLITEVLLELLTAAASAGAEVRFRWVRREYVQDADDLSKFVDRMDFGLKPARLSETWRRLGPWDIDCFACEHNTTCPRFNSLIESRHSEAVDAMAQDWSSGVSFILPNFHMIDQIIDKIERDNAEVVLIVPAWQHKPWWRRLHFGAWRARLTMAESIPAQALVAYNEHCFFSRATSRQSSTPCVRANGDRVAFSMVNSKTPSTASCGAHLVSGVCERSRCVLRYHTSVLAGHQS